MSDVIPLDFITGIVTEDTSVYSEPDENSEIVDVAYSYSHSDDIVEAGEVFDIDSQFEDDDFYHVFWLDQDWDGYISKKAFSPIEGDGFLHGTVVGEDSVNLLDFPGGKECGIIGELKEGDNFIVLRSWLYSDFESGYYDDFDDCYYILTEDGEFGYIWMGYVEIHE